MPWEKNYLALGLLGILLLSITTADNSVHILSKYGHQPLTSTTLKWLPVAHYNPNESKEIVIGGFEIVQDDGYINQAEKSEIKRRPLYVCRVMHSSVWVAGTQKDKEQLCTVTIHGIVQSYEKYELLENVDGAARIAWIQWDRYPPLLGAVAVDKMLVARHVVSGDEEDVTKPRYTHYIGSLNLDENFGNIIYVNGNGKEESARFGEILMETEPIRYELSTVKLNWAKKRDIKRTPRVLCKATIINEGTKSGNMAETCIFPYKHSVYWGRRHATLNGLNTTITLSNGTSLPNIIWGMLDEKNSTGFYNLLTILGPGTGINITIRANYTKMEVPYTATLISHYEDGETTSRVISGIRQEKTLIDIMPEFGPMYFLNNNSVVPTTVPPPPTTEPTTTTTTTTTKQPQETRKTTTQRQQINSAADHDENMIMLPKKTDISTSMQSDDGGPLSLKNKVEVTYGGACTFKSSLMLAPLLLILHRIT